MNWHCGGFDIDLTKPQLMGIVNVTPDSFSDGGSYTTVELAVAHAREMIAQGATIIDIGGESTRPGSVSPSTDEEIARVVPVVMALKGCGAALSVDTRHAAVAEASIAAGAHIINDVEGFRDPAMVRVAASSDAGLCVMHMQGTPETMQANPIYEDVTAEVTQYLKERALELEAAGIARERICLDPGYGFGKTVQHNLQLMAGLGDIVALGYPVLIGISRKSYIGKLFGIETPLDRDEPSAQIAVSLLERGAHIARVHNVEASVSALQRLATAHHSAYVALGSNMGDRLNYLRDALAMIESIPTTSVVATSHIYESEPAYKTDQASFANAVIKVSTSLDALAFFAELQVIEAVMKRVKEEVNGPRNIDVDLLAFDDAIIDLPGLKVPHPRIAERDFVVTPLLEIETDFVVPGAGKLTREHISYGAVTSVLAPFSA